MGFGGAKQQVPSPWGGKQFKPQCRCSFFANVAAQFGSPRLIDGHVALLPLSLNVGGVGNLRPNDPVPVCGKLSRDEVCQGIRAFCKKLFLPVPDLDHFLPCSLFNETGAVLRQLGNLATHLAQFQYIRIVDKGNCGGSAGHGAGTRSTNSC